MPQFSSYSTDPNYATAFIITWASAAALCALVALPRLVRSARQGQLWAGLRGVGEDFEHRAYQPIVDDIDEKEQPLGDIVRPSPPISTPGWSDCARGWATTLGALTLYSPPYVRLDLGQSTCLFAREGLPGITSLVTILSLRDTWLSSHSNSLHSSQSPNPREWK